MAAPVAIGGVGGSGTRLVARILRETGIHMGDDLNLSSDTLWFTLLFKRIDILRCDEGQFGLLISALVGGLRRGTPLDATVELLVRSLARADRLQHKADWLQERAESLVEAARRAGHGRRWGWKEPNTHVVIERIWRHMPRLRYVHVVRHGLDMAHNSNQNQPQLWGECMLGARGPVTPSRSLAYWCHTHRRMQRLLAENPQRMYWLDYDALCRNPQEEAGKLCGFLDCDVRLAGPVLAQVREPVRHDNGDLHGLDRDDVEYVRSLGYVC